MKLAIVIVLPLVALTPVAAAKSFEVAGVVRVSADIAPASNCTVGMDSEVCLVERDTNGTERPSDDEISVYKGVDAITVSLKPPISTGQHHIVAEPSAFRSQHPAFAILNETWPEANDALPQQAKDHVTLESRPWLNNETKWGIFVGLHDSLPLPMIGDPIQKLEVGFCWSVCNIDKNTLFMSNETTFQALPENVLIRSDTDWTVEGNIEGMTSCPRFATLPEACLGLREPLHRLADLWEDLTPRITFGFSFNRATIHVVSPPLGQLVDFAGRASDGVEEPRTTTGGDGGEELGVSRVQATMDRRFEMPGSLDQMSLRQWTPPFAAAPLLMPDDTVLVTVGAVLLAVLALVLYHRILKSRALEQGTRRRIHDAIAMQPGIRIGTLRKHLGLNYNTIKKHVEVLKRHGFVEEAGAGHRRLFARTGTIRCSEERQAIIAASTPAARAILEYVRTNGRAELHAIRETLLLPRSTASTAISRLIAAGLITKGRNGRRLVLEEARGPETV